MKFGHINNYILFGGGDLLIDIAKYLVSRNYTVNVVTSERHINEKLVLSDFTFEEKLNKNSIKYIITSNINADKNVKKLINNNTMGLSFGAAWIFKESFINQFNGKLLNFHGSRLPKNRGGGGWTWVIMMGDKDGAALIHQIVPGIDIGDIIYYKNYIFPAKCRIPIDYYNVSINKYKLLFKAFLARIEDNKHFKLSKQSEGSSTYWPRVNTDLHGYINWNHDLIHIENFINAFDRPYKGAITYINGIKVRIRNVFSNDKYGLHHPYQAGLIYRIYKNQIMVATLSGTIIINELYDNNGNNIISKVQIGDRFYTPMKKLEKAMITRVMYSSKKMTTK